MSRPPGRRQGLAVELLAKHGAASALKGVVAVHAVRGDRSPDACRAQRRRGGADVLARLALGRANGRACLFVLEDAVVRGPAKRAES